MVACDSSPNVPPNLTAPSTTTSSSPTSPQNAVATQSWPVQVTLRSVTGPDDCRTHSSYSHIGTSGTQSVQVTDADGADGQIVEFYYGVPTDDATYEGVLHDGMFSAASVPPSMVEVLGNCVTGGATETFTFSCTR